MARFQLLKFKEEYNFLYGKFLIGQIDLELVVQLHLEIYLLINHLKI